MIEFLYRRIINNKWLFLCLLLGALLTTAIISAIPMYSNAILQKVLVKDLETAHLADGNARSKYSVIYTGDDKPTANISEVIENQLALAEQMRAQYRFPTKEVVQEVRLGRMFITRESDDYYNNQKYFVYPTAIDGLGDKVQLIYGKMPAAEPVDGVYEVVFSENAMKENQLIKEGTYTLEIFDKEAKGNVALLQFKIVGVFTIGDVNALYWSEARYERYFQNILFDQKALLSLAGMNQNTSIKDMESAYFFDYKTIQISDIPGVKAIYAAQQRKIPSEASFTSLKFPAIKVLSSYLERQKKLRLTLLMLLIPLIIIMCFYALIISNLIIKNDKNEIAMLKSRGAKRGQIFLLYGVECGILSVFAMVFGPFLGHFLCKILGSSNGFLEFVSRKSLNLSLSAEVYLYALIATIGFSLFVLVPAFKASNTSIVEYKRSLLNFGGKPFWKKFYLDFIIFALSIYGLYTFRTKSSMVGSSGATGSDVNIDPFIFFISTFFILGVSLVFLRIYPMIIQLIFKIGQKKWNAVMYFSLVNVGKADKNLQSIMLFIILTLSFGIINANQARTINSNIEDRVMYQNGAEIVVEPYNNLKHINGSVPPSMQLLTNGDGEPVSFVEPAYDDYQAIEGVKSMTKVYRSDGATSLTSGTGNIPKLDVMGIIPNEFGDTVWFRNDLLPYHINEYLNVMSSMPSGVLLSTSIKEDFDLQLGDKVTVLFGKIGAIDCTVSGFIDHFPTYYPMTVDNKKSYLAVVNFNYMVNKLPVQPYEIWIKKKADVLDSTIHKGIIDKKLVLDRADYAMQETIEKKNDPMLLGTNGILTMCFMMTMLIATIGFIIFWALSIRERSLKFGIFRAIGMPMSHVNFIMMSEQLLVSGVAIAMGFGLGTVASEVVIPLLEIVYSSQGQVPAFKIIAEPGDYLKVLAMTMIMVVTGLIVLTRMVKRIKINQVIKLGEDS